MFGICVSAVKFLKKRNLAKVQPRNLMFAAQFNFKL